LLDFLNRFAKETEIQVVFTTHSMSLVERLGTLTQNNNRSSEEEAVNTVEWSLLSTSIIPNRLEIRRNPNPAEVRSDLLAEPIHEDRQLKYMLFTEDAEAYWFLQKLIPNLSELVEYRELSTLGSNSMITIMEQAPDYIVNDILVFDADLDTNKKNKLQQATSNAKARRNMTLRSILLPGSYSPEKEFHHLLEQLISEDPSFFDNGMVYAFSAYEEDCSSYNLNLSATNTRDDYKKWFKERLDIFERLQLFDHWKARNQEACDRFVQEFNALLNS
jgi:hypothetical protein